MSNIIIRQAKTTDAEQALLLIEAAIHEMAYIYTGARSAQEAQAGLRDLFQHKNNRLSYEHTLIAEKEREIVGLVIGFAGWLEPQLIQTMEERLRTITNDTPTLLMREAQDDEFYLDTLSVDERFRGQKIGSQLMQAMEKQARLQKATKLSLNVDQENERALLLYQRQGYQITGTIELYQHPYWHMVKSLT